MSDDPMPTAAAMPEWKWGFYHGTLPNYIFGNTYATAGSNLNPTNPLTLPNGLRSLELGNMYSPYDPKTTLMNYLCDNGKEGSFDWTQDNLKILSDVSLLYQLFKNLNPSIFRG